MKLIGLTGGVGMGKSAAAGFLAQRQVPVIDTDLVARDLVRPGQPALEEIRATFGEAVFDREQQLNRAALAQIVFADPNRRQALERILHPQIRRQWQAQVEQWRKEGTHACAVVVIPLLFETGCEGSFDLILCVACSSATQARRLQQREWTQEHLQERIAAQWPVEEKMARADAVVWTEVSLAVHEAQIERIISPLNTFLPKR